MFKMSNRPGEVICCYLPFQPGTYLGKFIVSSLYPDRQFYRTRADSSWDGKNKKGPDQEGKQNEADCDKQLIIDFWWWWVNTWRTGIFQSFFFGLASFFFCCNEFFLIFLI